MTSFSRQPPLIAPTVVSSGSTTMRAPGARYAEPATLMRVASTLVPDAPLSAPMIRSISVTWS